MITSFAEISPSNKEFFKIGKLLDIYDDERNTVKGMMTSYSKESVMDYYKGHDIIRLSIPDDCKFDEIDVKGAKYYRSDKLIVEEVINRNDYDRMIECGIKMNWIDISLLSTPITFENLKKYKDKLCWDSISRNNLYELTDEFFEEFSDYLDMKWIYAHRLNELSEEHQEDLKEEFGEFDSDYFEDSYDEF